MTQVRLIMLIFLLEPLVFGNWLSRIPEVQAGLGLSPAELALALLGMPIANLLILPFAGRICHVVGARNLLIATFAGMLLILTLPGLAFNIPSLFLILASCGALLALAELAMNVEAARIEEEAGRLIMSTCHGCWSVGIGVGSFVGATLATFGLSVTEALVLSVAVILPIAVWAGLQLPAEPVKETKAEEAPMPSFFTIPPKALLLVCIFSIGFAVTEGAMGDWSGIFLRDETGTPTSMLGYGYAVFAALLSAGRFMGDALRQRLGMVMLGRLSVSIALGGAVLLSVATNFWVGAVAFGMIGLGISTAFPMAVTAVTSIPGTAAGNVAILSAIYVLGFLAGPLVIGGLAEFLGIRVGLMFLIPVLFVSLMLTGSLRPGDRKAPEEAEPARA
ncbi:MFS transporter [Pleomorphomonas diazotrophica]|uniref:MFS transporter n=1 Tax=Pleomorphomonas diazotrophica TaxID=1166257 RepID=A0A1I4QSA7_9HYPH|nr:MFS transporter [Pleomorphomonas diazotrophica]PKR90478.1 MFS transporter [Pleomorphomonas diazotrophica]SFM42586.1 Predicted arabinose efflux permease, MFS family [Pleomorphomonas diazotrophica]